MTPAPVDIAYSLPDDWIQKTLDYQPEDHLRPLVGRLQSVVLRHRERAIVLRHVQELALISCGLREPGDSLINGLLVLLPELSTTAGGWAVDVPLAERDWTRKSIHQIGKDLDSLWAEWMVLERFIDMGWTPLETPRHRSSPDWTIQRGLVRLTVEVKHKHALGSCRHRLTWFLRGLSFLPAYQFLKEYDWDWMAPDNLRDRDVDGFVNQVLGILPALGRFLETSRPYNELRQDALSCLIEGEGEFILEYRGQDGRNVQLHGRREPLRGTFHPGSIEVAITRGRPDSTQQAEVIATFQDRFPKIQADRDFVCIVWPVPWHWRPTEEWVVQTVLKLDSVWGQRAGALWPLGWSVNDPLRRWFLNERAEDLLRI